MIFVSTQISLPATYLELQTTLVIPSTDISKYQSEWFGHIPYFYLHFNDCYLKLLISNSKFSETRARLFKALLA